jgi:hypothetical protein
MVAAESLQTNAHLPVQNICLQVTSLAAESIARISAANDITVAELKSEIGRVAGFEYGMIVQELSCGPRVLADVASLQASGLSDGDVLTASLARIISGEFGERRVDCITCGSHETMHVSFSNSLPFVEISTPSGEVSTFLYVVGSVRRYDSDHFEVQLELAENENEEAFSIHGTLFVSTKDLSRRRLVVPHLDVDVLDVEYLEGKRIEMRRLRLALMEGCDLMGGLVKVDQSGVFPVLSSSRRWFQETDLANVYAFQGWLNKQGHDPMWSLTPEADAPSWLTEQEDTIFELSRQFQEGPACQRQSKRCRKVLDGKLWRDECRKHTRTGEVMLLKRCRNRTNRVRSLARKDEFAAKWFVETVGQGRFRTCQP